MSTSILLVGKIVKKADVYKVSDTFRKQEVWMTIDGDTQWPHDVPVEFINDNIDKCVVHKYSEGDTVEIDCNVRGQYNKDKDKLFPKLQGWRMRGTASGGGAPDSPSSTNQDEDDLPY
jgi:hypothetical protein